MLRVLDLCCGTKSVKKALEAPQDGRSGLSCEYVGVDTEATYIPEVHMDVREWDYMSSYPPGYFDIVWASPPCTEYSLAKTRGVRDLATADSIVQRCLDIIRYFEPKHWFIENPATGLLKTREIMRPLERYRHTCTYCKYGCDYKKATSIWTNREGLTLKHCTDDPCDYKRQHGIHFACAQGGPRNGFARSARRSETYQIPPLLLNELLGGCVSLRRVHSV
jgi:hypothetical protein